MLKTLYYLIIVELHSSGIVVSRLRPFLVWGLRNFETAVGMQKTFASV